MNSTVFAPWEDPEKKPLIRFQNVTKKFGTFTAIDNLSLDIYEREFFALLGPSGCGKTTMMRMLAGFETPTSGRIELAGKNIIPVPPNKRATNMMFQSYALFPHLSVAENVAFGLKREGLASSEVKQRVEQMLDMVQLGHLGKRKPNHLSGGQRQRVALARALAKRPKLLLLDEIAGGLTEQECLELVGTIQEIHAAGTTIIWIEHIVHALLSVVGRLMVIDFGKKLDEGEPQAVMGNPKVQEIYMGISAE